MNYEKMNCPVCSKPLSDPYDVVCCPECGAPHHRECWSNLGRCGYSELHGTSEQWSLEKASIKEHNNANSQVQTQSNTEFADNDLQRDSDQSDGNPQNNAEPFIGSYHGAHNPTNENNEINYCSKCGSPVTSDMDFCQKCGNRLRGAAFSPMPALPVNYGGGINYEDDHGETIEDIPVKELKLFIRTNCDYYINKFRNIFNNKIKLNWNFSAFFFSKSWLLYRRVMTPFLIITAITYLFAFPLIMSLVDVTMEFMQAASISAYDANAFYEMLYDPVKTEQILMSTASYGSFTLWLYINAGVQLVLHTVIGLTGNMLYGKHCIKTIGQLRAQSDANSQQYKTNLFFRGGTRAMLPVVYCIFAYTLFNFVSTYLMQI